MIKNIKEYINEIEQFSSSDSDEIEQFKIKFLSKKGIIANLFAEFKTISDDKKRELGKELNNLKNASFWLRMYR